MRKTTTRKVDFFTSTTYNYILQPNLPYTVVVASLLRKAAAVRNADTQCATTATPTTLVLGLVWGAAGDFVSVSVSIPMAPSSHTHYESSSAIVGRMGQ